MAKQRIIDTWITNNYTILSDSEAKKYTNESNFQSRYSNLKEQGLTPNILCVIEGRWSKDNAVSVNGRFYPKFWKKQLAKEQTQFLLRKGLMWMLFGHVDRGIDDKDAEEGIIAGIVTHLEVIDQPVVRNGKQYEPGDLFGRAIIIETGGKNAGYTTYSLLKAGCDISISSRGLGEYIIGETHTCEDGSQIPIMNPDTYELETFDFTRLPGISCAEVHMVKDNQNESMDYSNKKVDIKDFDDVDELLNDSLDTFENESFDIPDTTLNYFNENAQSLIFNINQKENNMAKLNGIKVPASPPIAEPMTQ